jgi:hypothetical protein
MQLQPITITTVTITTTHQTILAKLTSNFNKLMETGSVFVHLHSLWTELTKLVIDHR